MQIIQPSGIVYGNTAETEFLDRVTDLDTDTSMVVLDNPDALLLDEMGFTQAGGCQMTVAAVSSICQVLGGGTSIMMTDLYESLGYKSGFGRYKRGTETKSQIRDTMSSIWNALVKLRFSRLKGRSLLVERGDIITGLVGKRSHHVRPIDWLLNFKKLPLVHDMSFYDGSIQDGLVVARYLPGKTSSDIGLRAEYDRQPHAFGTAIKAGWWMSTPPSTPNTTAGRVYVAGARNGATNDRPQITLRSRSIKKDTDLFTPLSRSIKVLDHKWIQTRIHKLQSQQIPIQKDDPEARAFEERLVGNLMQKRVSVVLARTAVTLQRAHIPSEQKTVSEWDMFCTLAVLPSYTSILRSRVAMEYVIHKFLTGQMVFAR